MNENNVKLYFEVKDSGIGMTEEQIEKILEPFVQAQSDTMRRYGGTGLGLTIARNILDMMGGTLSIESSPGNGSIFSFELTLETTDKTKDILKKKIKLIDFEKPTFEGEILVCEDNVMNQQVICDHLTRVGLKTVVAENGKIGLDMVQDRMKKNEKLFDLIFMDMHMPLMDGIEAAQRIQELNSDIPIVAMTANIMSNDLERYATLGIHDYIGKPFTSQELWRCLMNYFTPVTLLKEDTDQSIESDKNLRQKIINIFVNDNETKFDEITAAINSDNIRLAHRLVHSLKSNAGQLNMTGLQQIAGKVESLLSDGANLVTPQHMTDLKFELNAALETYKPLLREPVQVTQDKEPA